MFGEVALKNKKKPHFLDPPNSISDQIYKKLKQQIIHGDIEPGERLRQGQVAGSLKASRTPVREAFRRLEQDGLVERLPQGGVRVTPLDINTIREVFGIRKVLEAYAIELACEHITPEEIKNLKRLLSQARGLLASGPHDLENKIMNLFELNSEFHDAIYRAAENFYLWSMINSLRNIVSRLRFLGLRSYKNWSRAWKEHGQLIEFLQKRDRQAAVKLMQIHLANAAKDVLTGMKMSGKIKIAEEHREIFEKILQEEHLLEKLF